MENLVGRQTEIRVLQEALKTPEAELIAVYGRRRVGKTYLVRSVYERNIVFEFTGANGVNLATQLENFALTLQTVFKLDPSVPVAVPGNWLQAFHLLINLLEARPSTEKQVIFLDEFPWLDNKKSGFLAAFDHFWNSWASKRRNLIVVICGSAASWMIQNVVRNKGGLHNRITQRIRLEPFTLHETALFLQRNRVNMTPYDMAQLYMVTGGIPYYLRFVRAGESPAQVIDRLCFTKDGVLRNEFKDFYPALFGKADRHLAIIRCLAGKYGGMTRKEIIEACHFKTGGTVSKTLDELEESGFITEYLPFGKTAKDSIFKLTDEYTLFYLKFMERSKTAGPGTWEKKSAEQTWKSWRGLAFENICLKHISQIKKALGISGIYAEPSIWRYVPKQGEKGVQIDLLLDRQDNCINLFEIKFYRTEYALEKEDADDLETKRQVFIEKTGAKKTVFITLLTAFGAKTNAYFLQTIQNQLTMGALFEPV
ncbi:MAG: AAA family ATPase [Thermoanaerobaculia bacterium]|nr:AAA family ATPase [Thermoanaerobaculia bacterium]